jgi:hypothetical protein
MQKRMMVLVVLFVLGFMCGKASAGAWEFRFFGVNTADFKGRDWKPVVLGAVSSLVVHELGHIAAAELTGMDARFDWNQRIVIMDQYWDKSSDSKALAHAGGFLGQLLVGGLLTAAPATRHSDFAVGFNGFTAANSLMYAVTGGRDESSSDVANLNKVGYSGEGSALISSFIGGVLLYHNLDKED